MKLFSSMTWIKLKKVHYNGRLGVKLYMCDIMNYYISMDFISYSKVKGVECHQKSEHNSNLTLP